MKAITVNEDFDESNPWVQKFLEEYPGEENEVDPSDLASFIDDNWAEITGLTNRDKDQEGYFPEEVEMILDELGVDYTDFGDAWGMQREGADDWDWQSEEDDYYDDDDDEEFDNEEFEEDEDY